MKTERGQPRRPCASDFMHLDDISDTIKPARSKVMGVGVFHATGRNIKDSAFCAEGEHHG